MPTRKTSKKTKRTAKPAAKKKTAHKAAKSTVSELIVEEREISAKVPSRNLKTIAFEAKVKKENDETTAWLEEQAAELAQSGQKQHTVCADDVFEEFDKILTSGLYDKDFLDAIMANGTIESLEKAYGEAQSDLFKAQRKAMVLKLVVGKAHDLLEEQTLIFLSK